MTVCLLTSHRVNCAVRCFKYDVRGFFWFLHVKKYNLDKLTTPSTTTGTDSASTTTGATLGGPNSLFSTQKGLDSLNRSD